MLQIRFDGNPPAPSAETNDPRRDGARANGIRSTGASGEMIDRDLLYADFKPLIQRLVRQYGTDADLREELVGEIYFRFCALLDAFESARGVPLRAYLVKQLSVSVYTYARHHWRVHRREAPIDVSLEDIRGGRRDDPTSTWIDKVFADEIRNMLPEALSSLSQRQRRVVTMRYYEEKSFEDIAEALGVQPATARSLLRHAINGIRRRIAHTYPTELQAQPASRPARSPIPVLDVDVDEYDDVSTVVEQSCR